MTTERSAPTLWCDARNVVLLDVRRAFVVSLKYYAAYGVSALLFLLALYLTLPILREAGSIGTTMIFYEIRLPGGFQLAFSLPWAAPLLAMIFASWCLAISKRIEYQIWRVGNSTVQAAANMVLAGVKLRSRENKRLEALARTTGMALRHLVLSVLGIVQMSVIVLVLLVMEPLALLMMVTVAVALASIFRSAIWPVGRKDVIDTNGIEPLIGHRLRMSNAQRVFASLMPGTILLMLAFSRVADLFYFDLASLLFLALLISVFGSSIADLLQSFLRLQRRSELHRVMLAALRQHDSHEFKRRLAASTTSDDESSI